MEPTLDNAMIFGGIGNLRLAPHVREGRPANAVGSARPVAGNAGSESSVPTEAPARARHGFRPGEKVSISPAAQAALANEPSTTEASVPADPMAADANPGANDPTAASNAVVPPNVASAYAAASGTTPASTSDRPTPINTLFA